MDVRSVSCRQLILEIPGKTKIQCDLKRHLSPRTVGIITRSLPLKGNVHFLGKNIVYIETPVDSGTERPKNEFKKGDVAFLPSASSICFFLADASSKTMTQIGVAQNVDDLRSVSAGDMFRLYADL